MSRQLKQKQLDELEAQVSSTAQDILSKGRAWEDEGFPIQDAMAMRDMSDDAADVTTQEIRHKLAGRSLHANKEEPYTLIFPDGIPYAGMRDSNI